MDIISKATRRELISALRERYRLATRQGKGRILDEFVEVSGFHRKHAVRLFGMKASSASKEASIGRRVYDEATRQALIMIWEAADRICGKRLKAIIPDLLTAMEKHGHLKLESEVRRRVQSASAATIDRLLMSVRKSAGSRRRKRPGKRMTREIPVKTCHDWRDPQPGYLEIDFVVHSGGSMAGEYLHSLVATDVCSGWTEAIPLIAREQSLVVEGLRRIGSRMPVPIVGIDSDNDGAFINETLASYCQQERITLTRSRVHQKNDQAWIEQKNGAVIRRMVGHDRLSGIVAGQVLAQLLEAVRLYVNFFQPSFKLRERVREGAKIKKSYLPPATPCDRLLAHPAVSHELKESLKSQRAPLDPVGLLHRIRRGQSALAALSKGEPGDAPVQSDLREFLSQLPEMWKSGEVRPTHRKGPSKARHWRTREDPFALVWPDILVWLQADPDCTAKSLMGRLIERYPDSQHASHLRTLHRRIAEWRSTMARSLMLPGTADRQGFTPVSGTPPTTLGEFPLRLATLASAPTPPALADPNPSVNQ
jgi:hypothetical protein